jgi:hypothetical protein
LEVTDLYQENSKGIDLYKKTYAKIAKKKFPYLFDVETEIAIETLNRALKTLKFLDSTPQEGLARIPRLGTTGEVLTMIALESKNIEIIPSTLIEDVKERFDFTILGKQVDITTSPLPKTFIKKYSGKHPTTLFVPTEILSLKNDLRSPRNFYTKNTYVYKLLYENEFNVDTFLEDTLSINYENLTILYDLYHNGEHNSYNLTSDQYGNITQEYIENYRTFLNDLSSELECCSEV